MTPPLPALAAHARHPDRAAALAFAGVMAKALQAGRQPLIRGLAEARFQEMLQQHFDGLALSNGGGAAAPAGWDEFDELVELLLDHGALGDEQEAWLAYAIATASMGENHLWQDLGLPSRKVLSDLMGEHFPALAAKNVGDMKWKKFFYRQLCERAEVPICKSPHCAECVDYRLCFGPEN